ncbi:MAG: hypothetical protein GF383_00590 [Candidatus Lokiarchaeota archaeon]|nr:hypothetical protein [Candidatus Lokiarchaeota archaeon]MBD3337664.1 hypothetical protein [Candidatus Lokiarchaeota archaeon]
MKLKRLKVLSTNEIEAIHNSTVKLLSNIGIKVESPEARDIFLRNGAELDKTEQGNFIKITEDIFNEAIKKVPKSFSIYGPDGSNQTKINTSNSIFSTFGAAVNIFEPTRKKKIRRSKLEDAVKHIQVVNSLENISCCHLDIWPYDVPFMELHCHTLREWAKNSFKPYGMSCYGRTASLDMINIASLIVGGKEELIKKPRLIGVFNPTSPLTLPHLLLNGLIVFAKYGQPFNICSAASAGSTAPVTLGGLLVQTNAEVLSSIILTQLINPGTPVLYGSTNTIMDPQTGNSAYGSMEMGLISIAAAQLAHFYGIPSKGSGALTDSKMFDIQNGYERVLTLMCAANAGHNYITCAGTYETSLSAALELLVIDNDIIGSIKRGIKGIRLDNEALAIDQILRAAETGKNFLTMKHTVKNVRKEIFVPKISNRERRTSWIREGSLDIMANAKRKVDSLIKSYKRPELDLEIEKKIKEYTKKVASRTLEDYRRSEGMEDKNTSIEIGGINLENQ